MADSQVWLRQYEDDRRFDQVDDDEYCDDCGELADECICPIEDEDEIGDENAL